MSGQRRLLMSVLRRCWTIQKNNKLRFYVAFLVSVTLGCIGGFDHGRRHFDFRYSVTLPKDIAHIIRNMDALNIPRFNWLGIFLENAGNSADECLLCARITVSAFLVAGLLVIAFPVTPMT
jgi:hypothetical protein